MLSRRLLVGHLASDLLVLRLHHLRAPNAAHQHIGRTKSCRGGLNADPLRGVVEHLLPGRVKLPAVLLSEALLGQRDGLFGGAKDLGGSLEVLRGLLGFQLGLKRADGKCFTPDTNCFFKTVFLNAAFILEGWESKLIDFLKNDC